MQNETPALIQKAAATEKLQETWRFEMLKLTIKAGEYLLIGDEVKVVYTGGSGENAHILIDAPRSMNIARSSALEKYGRAPEPGNEVKHYRDRKLSPEAKEKIKAILMEERKKAR